MAASISSTTVAAKQAHKVYTNSGTSDVIATLNIVSQTATKNPKVNVSYSSSSNLTLNYSSDASWTLATNFDTAVGPASLSQQTATKGSMPYGLNLSDGTYGIMRGAAGGENPGYNWGNQFLDPYYLISPTSWDAKLVTPAFSKGRGPSDAYNTFWADFRVPMDATTWDELFGTTPNYTTGGSSTSFSYHSYGYIYDPYTMIQMNFSSNGSCQMKSAYQASGVMSSADWTSGSRTSDSFLYNRTGGDWNGSKVPEAQFPWARMLHCDNGMFIVDYTNYSSDTTNYFVLLNNRSFVPTTFPTTPYSSAPQDWINSSDGLNVRLRTKNTLRWLKYNPSTLKWYIRIGGDDDSTGLYSWSDFSAKYTTSTSGNGSYIEEHAHFTKETTASFPTAIADKMTEPARIGASLWISYDENANAYWTTDLITWKTPSDIDGLLPTGYLVKNTGTDGVEYYGKQASSAIKTVQSGYAAVDKAGWIESQTEVGRYERTGIIIPIGQSLYLENADETTSVSVSLLTMDI